MVTKYDKKWWNLKTGTGSKWPLNEVFDVFELVVTFFGIN